MLKWIMLKTFSSILHPQTLTVFFFFLWSIAWKGLALWRAALNKQTYWFVALLVLNTLGILEIVYLFIFAKQKLTVKEMRSWIKS